MFLKESSTTITYQNMKPSVIFIMGKKSEMFNIFFPKTQDLFLSKFPLFSLKISSHPDWPDGGFLDMGHQYNSELLISKTSHLYMLTAIWHYHRFLPEGIIMQM